MSGTIDELAHRYRSDLRRHPDGRPWVLLNMIAGIDGAISIDGVSGGLGGPADRAVFAALRDSCDVVLVAAGTARAEGYGPPRADPERVAARRAAGHAATPHLAVVSRSLDLDIDSALFSTPGVRPSIVTTVDADPGRLAQFGPVADLVQCGEREVDLRTAIGVLADAHGGVVLAEGGPVLNGALAAADLLHEICLTISPMVVGGDTGRLLGNRGHDPRRYRLDRVLGVDDMVFTRWLRHGDS